MAKHKAPTSITIASTTDKTALHAFVEENWKTAALVAVVVAAVIIGRQWISQKAQTAAGGSWDRLRETVPFIVQGGNDSFPSPDEVNFQSISPAAIAATADELRDDPAGPWAKALEAGKHLRLGDREAAITALSDLGAEWPDHPAFSTPLPFDADGDPQPLKAFLEARASEIDAWEAAHPLLFANPPLPEDAPRVRLVTDEGTIVLGLYEDEAPLHVANFLKLCGEGFYSGTRFHRVVPNRLIQGGDPNSIEGDPSTWGQGGPDHKVDPERNGLKHFSSVVAMAKMGTDKASSGSQFYITATPQHEFDGRYVVFGAVVEGADIVSALAGAPVQNGDRPENAVIIRSAEVVTE